MNVIIIKMARRNQEMWLKYLANWILKNPNRTVQTILTTPIPSIMPKNA
jgi:uncharacterized membrane protein